MDFYAITNYNMKVLYIQVSYYQKSFFEIRLFHSGSIKIIINSKYNRLRGRKLKRYYASFL